jgi:hypothetical protein
MYAILLCVIRPLHPIGDASTPTIVHGIAVLLCLHAQLLYTSGQDLEGAKRMEKGSRTGAVDQVRGNTAARYRCCAHGN